MIDMFCAHGRDLASEEDVNVLWFFKDLMISYKFGEKHLFERDLKKLKPYMDETLFRFFEAILEESLWTNPITGKKGY